jgi:hypothetical protein
MAKRRRGGRPCKDGARYRNSTRAGRAPPADRGTEQVQRLRRALTPSRSSLEVDPLAADRESGSLVAEAKRLIGLPPTPRASAPRLGIPRVCRMSFERMMAAGDLAGREAA